MVNAKTLVLDKNYMPLRMREWYEEIVDVLQGKLRVIANYEDETIRTVRLELKVPAVVVSTGERSSGARVKLSRNNIWLRDKGQCQYCGVKLGRREMAWDHVVPRVQGGTSVWKNLVCCCVPCNKHKGGRTPREAGMRLLKVPTEPDWLPRVAWTWVRERGMPKKLVQILRDLEYWNVALDED